MAAPDDRNGERFTLMGRPLKCPHCGHGAFHQGSALLNTAGMTFFNLDWANRSATTLACTQCGHIDWFMETPDRVE